MSQEVGALHYDLDIDDKKLKGALDAADKNVSSFGDKVSKHWDTATAASQKFMMGIAAVGAATVAFGVTSVKAYNDAAEATTKLRTNLLNVKGATEDHVKALEEQASSLQAIGVIEDDVIKAGMSQLATFNLQGSTIQKVTPKITDMVAQLKGYNATSEDMVTINNLVGKVLTGNVGALSRYGVTLDDNQAKVLANGTEAEKAAKLVEVLSQNYGNVNEALRNTPQGQITALKNAFGDLQEGVGELIMAGISPLVKSFGSWLTKVEEAGGFLEYFKNLIHEHETAFKMLAGAIVAMMIPALVSMAISAAPIIAALVVLAAVGAGIVWVAEKIAEKMGGWDEVMKKLQPTLDKIKQWWEYAKDVGVNVWDWIKKAAQEAWEAVKVFISGDFSAGIFGLAPDHPVVVMFSTLRDVITGAWDAFMGIINFIISIAVPVFNALKAVWDFLYPSIAALVSTLWDRLLPALTDIWNAVVRLWNALNPALMDALKIIGAIIGVVVIAAIWLFINVLNVVISVISFVINIIANLINWFANLIGWIGNVVSGFINMVKEIIGWFGRIPENVKNIIGNVVDWFKGLPSRITGAISGIGDVLTGPFKAAFNAIARFWNNSIGSLSFKAPDWVPGLGGKGFSMPQLPYLAQGGVVTGPMAAVIGEAGNEAVMPLDYLNRYTNLFDRIEDTARAVAGASGNTRMGDTIVNIGTIEDRQDADYVLRRLGRDQERLMMGISQG